MGVENGRLLNVVDGEWRDILKMMDPEELPQVPRGVCATNVKE